MKINQLFALQEITTLIISLKGIYNDDEIKKFLNYILYILWIPIRILLPYYCIYNYYNYNYIENIYFKIASITGCVFFLLNIKWTLLFLKCKVINYSLLLLLPILSIKNIFNLFLLTSLFGFI